MRHPAVIAASPGRHRGVIRPRLSMARWRAWPVPRGMSASADAGGIHDMEPRIGAFEITFRALRAQASSS
jgi:hypothetical protein